jgi:N-acetylglucosamine-6-phosphate deacetylase
LTLTDVIVSLCHSDCTFQQAGNAADQGARCVTHLFNAMSGLGNRQPGLVGAALEDGRLFAGLIADGHHVDPATMSIALRAKAGPGRIFLVSDAMSLVGTELTEFQLDGRLIRRANGKLTLEDGTLAGADIALIDAVRFVAGKMGIDKAEALRMASLYPAMAIGRSHEIGRLGPGTRADLIHLSDGLEVQGVWQSGRLHTQHQASFVH